MRIVALSGTLTLRTPVLVTTERTRPSTLSTSPFTIGDAAAAGEAAGLAPAAGLAAGLAAVAGLAATAGDPATAGEAAPAAGDAAAATGDAAAGAAVGLAASVGLGAAAGVAGGVLPHAVSSRAVVISATLRKRRGADPSMRGLHQSGLFAHLTGA